MMRQDTCQFDLPKTETRSAVAGAELLLVDPSVPLVELLGQHLDQLGASASGLSRPSDAISLARDRVCDPPDMVLVDLEFPLSSLNGLDVMMAFKKWCPESRLVVYTAVRRNERRLFQVAWESICPATAVSKTSPISKLIETVDSIAKTGEADVDPELRALLPHQRSPWRTAEGYRRLVPHVGHAKLWQTLLNHRTSPPYKVIALESQLSVNTIRNYRDDLLAELRLHGLDSPTMRQIHEFAHSARPLLVPVLDERLGAGGDRQDNVAGGVGATPDG